MSIVLDIKSVGGGYQIPFTVAMGIVTLYLSIPKA